MFTDFVNNDAFKAVSLTAAFIKAPYQPKRIGQLGLFRSSGITTNTAIVEYKDGVLELIQTSPRGGPGSTLGQQKRTAKSFLVPHLEKESTIMADTFQNVRAFGSDNQLAGVQAVVDERLAQLRQQHEVTLEYHRMGAIKGQILDADGSSTIFDLFTEFGVSQQVMDFDLTHPDVRSLCVAAQRLSEAELGAEGPSGYRAFCGDDFFDDFIGCDAVKETLKYQEGKTLREDLRTGFVFGGITWENYRGRVSGVDFVPASVAYLVPEGTSMFQTYYAPADFMEAVNTVGLPGYAKLVADKELDRWIKVHTQSNPLALNLRPRAVIKLTKTT